MCQYFVQAGGHFCPEPYSNTSASVVKYFFLVFTKIQLSATKPHLPEFFTQHRCAISGRFLKDGFGADVSVGSDSEAHVSRS